MPRFSAFRSNSSSNSRQFALERIRWILGVSFLLLYYGGGASGYGSGGAMSRGAFLHTALRASTTTLVVSPDPASTTIPQHYSYYYVFWLMPVARDATRLRTAIMNDLAHDYATVPIDPHVTLGPPVLAANIPDPRQALEDLTKSPLLLSSSLSSSSSPAAVTNEDTGDGIGIGSGSPPRLRGTTPAAPPRVVCASGATAAYGRTYTQSVFLQLDTNRDTATTTTIPALDALYQSSRAVSGLPYQAEIPTTDHFPHLSVWYANASEAERVTVAARVQDALMDNNNNNNNNNNSSICFDRVQLMRIELPVTSREDVEKWKVVGSAPLR
jgi:hypothetical protein